MTTKKKHGPRRERRVSVRAVRRGETDAKQLSRALVNYALQQAAAEAAALEDKRRRDNQDD